MYLMFFAAGILWQLLRLYTVSVLIKIRAKNAEQNGTNGEQPQADTKPIVDAEIINWANEKVSEIPKGATYATIHKKVCTLIHKPHYIQFDFTTCVLIWLLSELD